MSTYQIYSSLINQTHKQLRKILPKKERQSKSSAMRFVINNEPDFIHTLDFLIFCEEWSWMQSGHHTLFPESEDVLKRLASADFETRELSSLEMPFGSFVLAMPKGYEIDGVEMPSVLVTWGRFDEYGEERMAPLTDHLGLPRLGNRYPESSKGLMGLQIVYRDHQRKKDLVYARCSLTADQFHDLLKSRTLEDFQSRAGHYENSNFRAILDNDHHDLVIQFHMLKTIIAIAIFNQATDGVHIKEGVPTSKVKMIGRIPGERSVASTLSMPGIEKDTISPEAHYRRWHFRQLTHERYYQGEHSHKARGSRWTFVRDAYVGAPTESAYTLEEKDS